MKTFFLAFITFVCLQSICAQQLDRQVFSSAGSSIKSGNIWLDYTIGETSVITFISGSIVLNQGFQQVYNTGLKIANILPASSIQVYPNPTSGRLQVDIPEEMVNASSYKLIDMSGRLISGENDVNPTLNSKNTTLNISDLPYGVYLLSIQIQNTNRTYIYRILKL